MKAKNINNLPAAESLKDADVILISQDGHAVLLTMSELREYIGYASGADVLGVPAPTAADAGYVPTVNDTGTGYNLAPIVKRNDAGHMILTEGVDYGDTLPEPGTPGRIFFLKV